MTAFRMPALSVALATYNGGRHLRAQLDSLATQRVLPLELVVADDGSTDDTLAILEEEGAREVGGVIHCFSEDRPFAERALALGFDLSFSGIVTFKSAPAVQEVAAWAPGDRILVETDSPYLAPVPFRGKTNNPSYVPYVAKQLAALRGVSVEDIASVTSANFEALFSAVNS